MINLSYLKRKAFSTKIDNIRMGSALKKAKEVNIVMGVLLSPFFIVEPFLGVCAVACTTGGSMGVCSSLYYMRF